ncbi:hypothetical protein [Paraburkholderia piptadeniae]|nr:hypothetical protein [Paraburkholderia piptadeniae]
MEPGSAIGDRAATGSHGALLLLMAVWGFTLPLVKWLTGHFDIVSCPRSG